MRFIPAAAILLVLLPSAAASGTRSEDDRTQPQDLKKLSIEELTQLDVTSVSRRPEPISRVAAAVSVIRAEDIRRSSSVILAEVMRLGDAVDVGRVNGRTWGISTRGFNISTANKLLVLVDGRSTYSGLFGGTFWDAQDAFLPDIDRIEVIRGPGGTIWGANAVNGVINVISKPSAQTQGTLVSVVGGFNERAVVSARYGDYLGSGHYRIYGKYRMREAQVTPSGDSTQDETQFGQAGFQYDSNQAAANRWFVTGALYRGTNGFADRDDADVAGGHLLGRWTRRTGSGEALSVLAFYDYSYRKVPLQFEGTKNTGEIDVQQQLNRGRHLLVIGGTARMSRFDDLGTAGFRFDPQVRTGWTATAFAQDEITLVRERAYATVGAKFGSNNYTGVEFQPNLRLRIHPSQKQMAWAAVSRAVRLPTRVDEDLRQLVPATGTVFLRGSEDFDPEAVIAYEGGYRVVPHPRVSVDVAAFVNDYDRLRSQELRFEPAPVVVLENRLNARTHGIELATTVQPATPWRVHASYAWLRESFTVDTGSTHRTGRTSEANDPGHMVSARSYLDLPRNFALDAILRFVGRRPSPAVKSYAELDLRLGWGPRPGWELSLVGQNLLHKRHAELFSPATPTWFPRSAFLRSAWTF
ncbi:MAG: TonB-dependent receptor [Acidobacteria bacterium]|nr:TonB-dependent receptor [Acidobacteriota bacterium]